MEESRMTVSKCWKFLLKFIQNLITYFFVMKTWKFLLYEGNPSIHFSCVIGPFFHTNSFVLCKFTLIFSSFHNCSFGFKLDQTALLSLSETRWQFVSLLFWLIEKNHPGEIFRFFIKSVLLLFSICASFSYKISIITTCWEPVSHSEGTQGDPSPEGWYNFCHFGSSLGSPPSELCPENQKQAELTFL